MQIQNSRNPSTSTQTSYELNDLLKEANIQPVVQYLKRNRPSDQEIIQFIQTLIAHENVHVIKNMIKHDLIQPNLLQDSKLRRALIDAFKITCKQSEQNEELIICLLETGIEFDEDDIYGVSKRGNFSLLKSFLDKGADIRKAIFKLVEHKQEHVISRLLERKTGLDSLDPNLRNEEGNTLLIEAVKQDHPPLVRTLLEWGANPLIRDNQGCTVFDLSKQKSLLTRTLLYDPPNTRLGSGGGYNYTIKSPEEEALNKLLATKAQGKQIGKFYGLFIKVNHVALVILKSTGFSTKMLDCLQQSTYEHPHNHIHSWVSSTQYPIPEEFGARVNHTSMSTLGFAIIQSSQSQIGDIVTINKQHYAVIPLENSFKTKNPNIEYGFKYSYEGVQTHGHGKNPEAARSAFNEHRDGVRLSHWVSIPDLSADQDTLLQFSTQINQMFDKEQENSGQLEQLAERINTFLDQSKSIIEARHDLTSSNSTKKEEEDSLIEQGYQEISKDLKNAHAYTFHEKRFQEWQSMIHQQITALQNLERKLEEKKPMSLSSFEAEREMADEHLEEIKDLVAHQGVTSAEIPTLKIYTSFQLVEDIFQASPTAIQSIKATICQLIGSILHQIPVKIDDHLVTHFLEDRFREDILTQLNAEAQFIVKCKNKNGHRLLQGRDCRPMQNLASSLALLQDTSFILETIPPVSLTPNQKGFADEVLEATMLKHLNSYQAARKILDNFWLEVCYDQAALKDEIDELLELLTQRVLLMDEEVREEGEECFLYPLMDGRHPKRILDEQLFLLQTSLLIALNSPSKQQAVTPSICSIIKHVQIRLSPALFGTERKKLKFDGFFLSSLHDVVYNTSELVEAAWQSNPSTDSQFKRLHDLFDRYPIPEKRKIESLFIGTFRQLSPTELQLNFDPSIEEFLATVREIRKEITGLVESFRSNSTDVVTVKEVREMLDQSLRAIDSIEFGNDVPQVAPHELLEILAHDTVSDSDKKRLKEGLMAGIVNEIRSSTKEILRQTKTLSDLDQIKTKQAKDLQSACAKCVKSIRDYLKTLTSPPILDFSLFKEKVIQTIEAIHETSKGTLEKSNNHLVIAKEMLAQDSLGEREIVSEVESLVKQLKQFFNGKRGARIAGQYDKDVQELANQLKLYLSALLPTMLSDQLTLLEKCQTALYKIYVNQVEKMSKQLSLGIRQQSYYPTQHKNLSYYVWDGKPFDAIPYHSDDNVHIPLDDDQEMSTNRGSRLVRSFVKSLPPSPQELHVTRMRALSKRVTKRLGKPEAPHEVIQRTEKTTSSILPNRDDLSIESLRTMFNNLVKKNQRENIDLNEILNFQSQLSRALPLLQGYVEYEKITNSTEALVVSILDSDPDKPSQPRTFDLYDGKYMVRPTKGQGSCALHALLGEEVAGKYQFPGDPDTCSPRAKEEFTNRLKTALQAKNSAVETVFRDVINNYLTQSDDSAKMLFHFSTKGQSLKQKWIDSNRLKNENIQRVNSEEAALWLPIILGENTSIFQLIMTEINKISDRDSPYYGKNQDEVKSMMQQDPLCALSKVNEQVDACLEFVDSENKGRISLLREERSRLLAEQLEENGRLILSQDFIEHYVETVKNPSFYLNTNEIKLATLLFEELHNKNVVIFSTNGDQIVPAENIPNPPVDEQEYRVIYSFGLHFSRCVKV